MSAKVIISSMCGDHIEVSIHLDATVADLRDAVASKCPRWANGEFFVKGDERALREAHTLHEAGVVDAQRGPVPVYVVPNRDRAVLLELFESTRGEHWVNNDGWGTSADISEWHGVTADARTGRVTKLDLRKNGLVGRLPSVVGELSSLERLYLSGNALAGELPDELGNLRKLERLWMAANADLMDELPACLGQLPRLKHVDFYGCKGIHVAPELRWRLHNYFGDDEHTRCVFLPT